MALAGPIEEDGIDPGRSVVPAGAPTEVDVTLMAFEGGIDVRHGHAPRGSASVGAVPSRCQGSCAIPVHERFADAPLAGPSDEDLYPIIDDTIDLAPWPVTPWCSSCPWPRCVATTAPGCVPSAGPTATRATCGCVAPRDPRWANLDVLR